MNGIGTYPENSWQSSKPATGSEPAITKTEPAPVFALSGPFSGSDGLPASRWLKKLQYDLKPSYPPVEEARCTKVEVEKLEAAEAKDAELQYYKNLVESRLHPSSQPQAYNPQSNASTAPKSNVHKA